MSLSINSNILSLQVQRQLADHTAESVRLIEQLSSGTRIQHARDDPAGLAIASRMTSRLRGMQVAMRNINDGNSMLQVADGAMVNIGDSLQRLRELAVQSGNGALSGSDRRALQLEAGQVLAQINGVDKQTAFNGQRLFAASGGGPRRIQIQAGADGGANNLIELQLSGMNASALGLADIDLKDTAGSLQSVDAAIEAVDRQRALVGAAGNRLDMATNVTQNTTLNLQASLSRIQDVDFASAATRLTRESILRQAALAMLSQANGQPNAILALLR